MSDRYEALTKVMRATETEFGYPTYEECAAAVVEFLTSDESAERALNILGWNKRNRYGIRAALLAAVGGSDVD